MFNIFPPQGLLLVIYSKIVRTHIVFNPVMRHISGKDGKWLQPMPGIHYGNRGQLLRACWLVHDFLLHASMYRIV